ncbi:hypothetical protein [Permianibacter aggregans]|uniref:Uncharacterized protein n=1 Tax=Permianibacter aggregans TaxID=1510150 RepID=A0A4R6U4L8_9GAMM|nr:hypothetical protein [Permianibacter aggregans]QGX39802.1 hypothetical protein E2H98_09090 [Permianibacter aggregans]TDQ41420.1 hypothetical protein EV696_1402 [Permianibacter aggregans]
MKTRLLMLISLVGSVVHSHQTNTTHPAVSALAKESVAREDAQAGAYYPIYSFNKVVADEVDDANSQRNVPHPIFWGLHAAFNHAQATVDADADYPFYRNRLRTAIDGVVMQDTPGGRVLSHFYNAYTGEGLGGTNTPSKEVAVARFLQSVELMGYSNDVRQSNRFGDLRWQGSPWKSGTNPTLDEFSVHDQYLSFYYFGHSLHHLEDMGSIAHVHADAHLTLAGVPGLDWASGWTDRHSTDDFEAIFIPFYLWRLGGNPAQSQEVLSAWYFNCEHSCQPASVASFDDIWPIPMPNPQAPDFSTVSFARKVYNTAIFQGDLPNPNLLGDWDSPLVPTGEIVEMFRRPNGAPGLRWNQSRRARYSGRTRTQGSSAEYFFQTGQLGFVLNYRPGSAGMGSSVWHVWELGGPRNHFYIEEHIPPEASNPGALNCASLLRPPGGVRADLRFAWSESNPLVQFGTGASSNDEIECGRESLLGRQAAVVMPTLVSYAAGYAKWWFDVANLPPYLQRVTVTQEHDLVEKTKFVAYDAEWKDIYKQGEIEDDGSGNVWDDDFKIHFVKERKLEINKDISEQPLNRNFDLEVILVFNEAIKAPTKNGQYDAASGFGIGFQKVDVESPSTGERVMLTSKINEMEIEELRKTPGGNNLDSEDTGRIWKVKIGKAILKDVDILKGGYVRLIITAKDKNKHIDKDGRGADLDGRPATPARRNVKHPDSGNLHGLNITNFVTWHDKDSLPGSIFSAIDDDGMQAGAFAYDDEKLDGGELVGDRMHIIWFGNEAKQEESQPNSNETENIRKDEVSITLEPKKTELKPETE